jgi:hypothetical protein
MAATCSFLDIWLGILGVLSVLDGAGKLPKAYVTVNGSKEKTVGKTKNKTELMVGISVSLPKPEAISFARSLPQWASTIW